MATCPIKTDPAWKTLVETEGEIEATRRYVENNYEIPKLNGYIDDHVYDIEGPKFNAISTRTKLNEAPHIAKEIIDKLKELFPEVIINEDGLFDNNGKWKKIPPGQDGMHIRNAFIGAVAWANDSMLETPPHEYAHDYIEMFQNHPLMQKAIEKYGVEGLATKMGQDFVNNTLNDNDYSLIKRIWNSIKGFFGFYDVADIISDNFYKGKEMTPHIHEGNKAINYNQKQEPLKRQQGAVDTNGQFNENSIELTSIDYDRSVDYIKTALQGYNVFGDLVTEFDLEGGGFVDKIVGDVNADRAVIVFQNMEKMIKTMDIGKNGKYKNVSGLSRKQLNQLTSRLAHKEGHAQKILDILQEKESVPPMDNSTELAQDYWTIIRMMQKLDYLAKADQSIIADDDKMIDKKVVKQKVQDEIESIHVRRKEIVDKYKNPVIKKAVDLITRGVTSYLITPYLTAKFLAGENGFLSKMYYQALNHADTVKLGIKQKFNKDLRLTEEMNKEMGLYSSFNDPKSHIDDFNGKSFELNVITSNKEMGKQETVKLTDAEILSLYLTLRQTGDQAIFPDSDSPSVSLEKNGFHLDVINGRKGFSKTKYMFTENTKNQIIEHIQNNKNLSKYAENVTNALEGLYPALNKTFKQQNGFNLPQYEMYFPVSSYFGAYDLKTQKSNIENLSSIRDRLGSNQAIIISDVNKILTYHSNAVSSYAAYAITIDNNNKIIKLLKNEYEGHEEFKVVNKLLNQMEGKLNSLNDPTFLSSSQGEKSMHARMNKLMSNFGISALSWNVGVMTKQPISYMAAKELMDVKYLRKAGWGVGRIAGISPKQIIKSLNYTGVRKGETILPVEFNMHTDNPVYQAILKHSPKLVARFAGAVDRETGEALFEKSFGNDDINLWKKKDGKRVKVSKARFMEGIKIFDAATVMSIWKAVELETQEKFPQLKVNSDAYFEHVAVRTEDIVNKSQPTFDLMNRTELASMSNPWVRSLTMFGSAKSKLGALMIEGIYDMAMNPTKENKTKAMNRIVNLGIYNGLQLAIITALFGLGFEGDDEEDGIGDDIAEFTTAQIIRGMAGQFYGVDKIVGSMVDRLEGKPWARTAFTVPVLGVLNEMGPAIMDVVLPYKIDKRNGERIWTIDDGLISLLKMSAQLSGIPLAPYRYTKKGVKLFGEDE